MNRIANDNNSVEWYFAKRNSDGKIVSINEVKRGKSCDCSCYSCGTAMIAKKSEKQKRSYHFAHEAKNAKCQQTKEKNNERALHEKAENILIENNRINLPSYFLHGEEDPNCNIWDERQRQDYECFAAKELNYLSAEKEKTIGCFRPDVVFNLGEEELFIEIEVTHAVDEDKKEKIKKFGTSCVEIDVTKFIKGDFCEEELRDFLINDIQSKKWIFHKDYEKYLKELQDRNLKLEQELKKEEEESRKEEEEYKKWCEEVKKEKEEEEYKKWREELI